MRKSKYILLILFWSRIVVAQNPLYIPPAISGTNFNLNIQNGITQFFPGVNTPTYGINGPLLAPTLIVYKWDTVMLNVTNNLTGFGNSTTMHWHGLHVPPEDDGGPHQIIPQGTTWSPQFEILNSAGTFWYHPHGDNKTDLHVSRGIAGMLIVKDSTEAALMLPRTYGIDDFPIIVQSKAFDILTQIAISTEMDTTICVNGTVNAFLDAPAQIIRLRLLNGSSSRVYNFGFSANQSFKMIASDGGLLDSAITMNRLRLAPGERAEILLDLQGMSGQTIYLNSFSSEFQNGIYGAATVTGPLGGTIPDYDLNPLNGIDFEILQINVIGMTGNPITAMPILLSPNIPWTAFTVSRNIDLLPDTLSSPVGQVEGPFNINGVHFDMGVINETVYLNDVEKWRITNNTGIAHPFHIHDIQFYLLNINGNAVPIHEQGKKDVVLVLPQQYVEFITKFENFANDSIPYMYHCHMLHHEDEGMMGSFRVVDTTVLNINEISINTEVNIFPNPSRDVVNIIAKPEQNISVLLYNSIGEELRYYNSLSQIQININDLDEGVYLLKVKTNNTYTFKKLIVL